MNHNQFNFLRGKAFAVLALSAVAVGSAIADDISPQARLQIAQILSYKRNFSLGQQKMDTNLVFAAKLARHEMPPTAGNWVGSVSSVVPVIGNGLVTVDIKGVPSESLLAKITEVGGNVISTSTRFNMIRASVPISKMDQVAGHGDVSRMRLPAQGQTNGFFSRYARPALGFPTPAGYSPFIGAVTSQGYVSHAANVAIAHGYNGTGVKVGVLSDSATPARVAALIATGDLPADTVVLAGQAGSGSDEGTAMMEIVHDLAPGAKLYFATAFNGEASFADNIIALKDAGCKVIVDDVSYFDEDPFQDGIIAQAVNTVTAAGVVYVSSAANSGNLTNGTSGTWEGDFVNGGPVTGPILTSGETGNFHKFGANNFDTVTAASSFYGLHWSDPLGASGNDYDFFLLNSAGTTVKDFSVGTQDGTQDPFEALGASNHAAGDRIVIVQFAGATRALHVDTERGRLALATSGATQGHNAGLNTLSMAATVWNSAHAGTVAFTGFANPIETFSSDGPRKIFFNPDGSAITAGNFLFGTNGGTTLQKPDVTAADGVFTKTPGFLPFFGTSAAAPHAAAIAALVFQAKPGYSAAQVKTAMRASALDNMAVGPDRDGGYGVAMAWQSVQYALSH